MMEYFMGDTPIGSKSVLAILGGSIGYSFRFYFESMVNNNAVKMISVDGIYPNTENIRNGAYPLTTKFYAVYRADNPNPNIEKLMNWLLSAEGQQLIENSGYVGL